MLVQLCARAHAASPPSCLVLLWVWSGGCGGYAVISSVIVAVALLVLVRVLPRRQLLQTVLRTPINIYAWVCCSLPMAWSG